MFKLIFNKRGATALLAICIVVSLALSGCGPKKISGNEWLVAQKACLEDLKAYAGGMDEVYTLYLTNAISQEDFLVELRLLEAQYNTLNQFYDKLKSDNPVKEGSHSYISKRGTEGIERCYAVLGKILDETTDEQGRPLTPQQLSYVYLAYKQELTNALSEYVTAILWYEDSQK